MKKIFVIVLLLVITFSYSEDVNVKLNPAGGFTIKNNDETMTHLEVANDGGLLANLPFGEMYVNNNMIYLQPQTPTGWTCANEGEFFNYDYVYFEDNTIADRLTIGSKGSGIYLLHIHGYIDINYEVVMGLYKNDILQDKFSYGIFPVGGGYEIISLNGALNLQESDYIDLRFQCNNASDIQIWNLNFTIIRISS